MNIIIEGPDNSGKSTLLAFLAEELPVYKIQTSGGPEQEPGELVERVRRYMQMTHTIFDRHPCISDPIYSIFRDTDCVIPQSMIDSFDRSNTFMIYCKRRGLGEHVIKPHETAEHVAMVEANHERICDAYEEWALRRANLIYRVGDNMGMIHAMIKAAIQYDHLNPSKRNG